MQVWIVWIVFDDPELFVSNIDLYVLFACVVGNQVAKEVKKPENRGKLTSMLSGKKWYSILTWDIFQNKIKTK